MEAGIESETETDGVKHQIHEKASFQMKRREPCLTSSGVILLSEVY